MTKERLIQLFMFQPTGGRYFLSFEHRKPGYKNDKPALEELRRDGLIVQRDKTTTRTLFEYLPKQTSRVR